MWVSLFLFFLLMTSLPFVHSTMSRLLTAANQILTKAQNDAVIKGIDLMKLPEMRLAPDMFSLAKQVQILSDNAKGAVGRLAGVEVPTMQDTETTIDELKVRLAKTLEFINSVDLSKTSTPEAHVHMAWMPGKHIVMRDYIDQLALPNAYFHAGMIYAIVRMAGIEIGKMDWLTVVNFQDGE